MSKLGPPPAKMTVLEHLDELRRRIIISLLAVAIAFALCFTFAQRIFDFLMGPNLRLDMAYNFYDSDLRSPEHFYSILVRVTR